MMSTIEEIIAEQFAGDPKLVEDILRDNERIERLYKENNGKKSRLELEDTDITRRVREYNFFLACRNGDIKKVQQSIKKLNVDINALDECGRNDNNAPNVTERLFANPNSPTETGLTGLDYALKHNQIAVVKFLKKHGALTSHEYREKYLMESISPRLD